MRNALLEDQEHAQQNASQGEGFGQAVTFAEDRRADSEAEHHVGSAQGRDDTDQGAGELVMIFKPLKPAY